MKLQDDITDSPTLKIGDKAPNFVLLAETGKEWRLSDQFGKVTALLFYPKNETLVCTRQMCSVRDNWLDYLETKAVVIGVSPGTIKEHRHFSRRYRLPLPILADPRREITKIYGKHRLLPIQLTRAVVIIDAHGFIRYRQIMLRAFRPTDRSVITSIYAARTDFLHEHISRIVGEARERNKYLG